MVLRFKMISDLDYCFMGFKLDSRKNSYSVGLASDKSGTYQIFPSEMSLGNPAIKFPIKEEAASFELRTSESGCLFYSYYPD